MSYTFTSLVPSPTSNLSLLTRNETTAFTNFITSNSSYVVLATKYGRWRKNTGVQTLRRTPLPGTDFSSCAGAYTCSRSGAGKPGNALAKAWDRGKTQWFAVIEGLGTRLDVVASFINTN